MPRRQNDLFWIEPVAGIVGLIVLLSYINPQVRSVLLGFSKVVFILISILITVVAGFVIYKFIRYRNQKLNILAIQHDSAPLSVVAIKPIDQLRKIDWYQFEKLVAYIYEKQGFNVTRKGGANPDGGIDLTIEKNSQISAIQCKQWKTWNVGVKPIREFLGALTDAQIQRGIFITLNGYTAEAKQLAEKHGIEIINEAGMGSMLERMDLNDPQILEILNDTRKICPKCEREMILRVAEKGPNPGQQFWGCSGYPKCRYTMPFELNVKKHEGA